MGSLEDVHLAYLAGLASSEIELAQQRVLDLEGSKLAQLQRQEEICYVTDELREKLEAIKARAHSEAERLRQALEAEGAAIMAEILPDDLEGAEAVRLAALEELRPLAIDGPRFMVRRVDQVWHEGDKTRTYAYTVAGLELLRHIEAADERPRWRTVAAECIQKIEKLSSIGRFKARELRLHGHWAAGLAGADHAVQRGLDWIAGLTAKP